MPCSRRGLVRSASAARSGSRSGRPLYSYWAEHNIVVRKDVEGMRAEPRPVVKTAELAAMIEERKAAERA